MYVIDGKVQVALYFGVPGQEVEFPLQDAFVSLQISTIMGTYLPTCRIVLTDPNRIFSKTGVLMDNQRFRIRVATGTGFQNALDYPMRVFEPHRASGSVESYAIDGYYDYPKFWGVSATRPVRASSADLIRQIAEECEMPTLMVASTADEQVWHPQNRRFSKFCHDVAKRGWISETSCMRTSVGDDGVLRYLDISNPKPNPSAPQLVFARNPGNNFRVQDSRHLSTAGFDNYTAGYGHRVQQSRVAQEEDISLEKVKVATHAPLAMNRAVKDIVAAGIRRSFAPVDGGNVYDRYVQAEYQNERLGHTWTQGALLQVGERTGFQLMDPVMVQFDSPGTEGDRERFQSGYHLLRGKTIYIAGGNYFEVLQVLRNSVNQSPGAAQ